MQHRLSRIGYFVEGQLQVRHRFHELERRVLDGIDDWPNFRLPAAITVQTTDAGKARVLGEPSQYKRHDQDIP